MEVIEGVKAGKEAAKETVAKDKGAHGDLQVVLSSSVQDRDKAYQADSMPRQAWQKLH